MNTRFKRIVKCFKKTWREQLGETTDKIMLNFAATFNLGCMEASESELVAARWLKSWTAKHDWISFWKWAGGTVQPLEEEINELPQSKPTEELTED